MQQQRCLEQQNGRQILQTFKNRLAGYHIFKRLVQFRSVNRLTG